MSAYDSRRCVWKLRANDSHLFEGVFCSKDYKAEAWTRRVADERAKPQGGEECHEVKKTERILEYLRNRTEEFPPTIREIQAACSITSTSIVAYHMDKLVERGLAAYEKGKSRTIRLLEPAPALEIVINLPWIPPAELRGNNREHYMARSRHIADLRDRGIEYGLLAKEEHPGIDYPIMGALALEVIAWNAKRIDIENALFGYKGFIDGLQRVVKRDEWGEVPGAGLIDDDAQFTEATIKPRIGTPRSRLVITRAAQE